jgi:hypothetical protein
MQMNYDTIIDDEQDGTPINQLRDHLDKIGYSSDDMPYKQNTQTMNVPQQNTIEYLADDVNNTLYNYNMKPTQQLQLPPPFGMQNKQPVKKAIKTPQNKSDDKKPKNKKELQITNKSNSPTIPLYFRELLLLLFIYIIMSMPAFQDTICKYIPNMKPQNGVYGMSNIIIYGILLASVFILLRNKLFYDEL